MWRGRVTAPTTRQPQEPSYVSTALNRQAMNDAELIAASRTGDGEAFGELYRRHAPAARAAARAMCRNRSDADDLVSEAFLNVLRTLQNGNGPELAFRPYLLVAVRNRFYDRTRRRQEEPADQPTEELDLALVDSTASGEDKMLAAVAFATLPERWQLVLWHTEVEGRTPAEIAPLIGLAPNSVAALAYRAREGLRQAYLQAHLQTPRDVDCRECAGHLGAYVRDSLSDRDRRKVDEHLAGCDSCRALLAELTDTNVMLRGALIPAIVGIPATAYLSGLGGKGVGAWLARLSRLQQVGAASAAAAAVAAVVTVAIVSTGGSHPTIAAPPTTRPRVEVANTIDSTSSTAVATATSTGTTIAVESLAPAPPTVGGTSPTTSPTTSSTGTVNRVPVRTVPQVTQTTAPATTVAAAGTSTTSTTVVSGTSTVPATTVPVIPRLALTSIQLGIGLLGGEVRVQVTVSATALPTNQFRTNAFSNLVVAVPLPPGVSLAGADNTAWSCTAQGVCTIASLSSGDSSTAVLRLRLALDAALPISLTPNVTSPANAVVQSQTLTIATGTIPGLQTQEFARGSVAAIGNTVMKCIVLDVLCSPVDVDNDKSTFNSSTADLQFSGSVAKALLVWSGDSASADRGTIKFLTPDGQLDITAEHIESDYSGDYKSAYVASADVTGWIDSGGTYGIADLQTSIALNGYGGWSLVVLTHDATQPLRSLMIAVPMSYVTSESPTTIGLAGSSIISTAHVVVSAFEGDQKLLGTLRLNGVDLGDVDPFRGAIAGVPRNPQLDLNYRVDVFDTTVADVAAGAVSLDVATTDDPVMIAAVGIALDVW
jgi:RNA polymerase sigma factor (sigma-70 family)